MAAPNKECWAQRFTRFIEALLRKGEGYAVDEKTTHEKWRKKHAGRVANDKKSNIIKNIEIQPDVTDKTKTTADILEEANKAIKTIASEYDLQQDEVRAVSLRKDSINGMLYPLSKVN